MLRLPSATFLGLLLFGTAIPQPILAANLTIPVAGKVSVEFVFADAAFSNTLSLVTPSATIAISGCKLVSVSPLPGLKLSSAKSSQRGCRITLDSDSVSAGVQGFAAGTTFEFRLCADSNNDGVCENVWSSNAGSNSDGKDHVITTPIHPVEFPGRIYQMAWEDQTNLGDNDFNDFVAVVRVDVDSDGDGLWDDWETFGIDTNGDGIIDLDLPALGANPRHKDAFVEIDFMDCAVAGSDCVAGDTHSHRPKTAAVNAVIQAFANANVTNPDGINGINLHIDVSNSIPHQNNLNINGLCFAGGSGIGSFDAVKADPANFGPNNPRRFAYHYSLFTHQQVATSTSSGCGELPGNDFQVALGGWNVGAGDLDGDGLPDANVGTVQQQAGTLMHELGHNLSLGHGGGDGVNFKPNYLSIMNYRFQVSGIPPTDPDGAGPLAGRVDYSRAALANLNETSLTESAGIGDGTDNTFFLCPSGSVASGAGTGPIDWNCNGNTTGTGISNDLNGDRTCIAPGPNGVLNSVASGDDVVAGGAIWDGPDRTCNSTAAGDDVQVRAVGNVQTNPLTGFWDWNNLKLDFQNTAGFEDGDHTSERVIEMDYPTFLLTAAPDLTIVATASPNPVQIGAKVTYTLTVKNLRPAPATNIVVVDTLPASVTFLTCAATGGGVCGGSGNSRTVTFASMAGGGSATITLEATVSCSVANGTAINNTATVSSTPADADLTNNSSTAATILSNPLMAIANYQFVSQQPAAAGRAYFNYRADLVNPGGALGAVTASATTLDPFSIRPVPGQSTLTFSPVPASSQITSLSTFALLVDPGTAVDFCKLQWQFQTSPAPPVARPGSNRTVTVGSTVTLDGSGSTNPSGIGTLVYNWVFTSRPVGTAAKLTNSTLPIATFVPDIPGTYVVALTVSNGTASNTASVTVVVTP